MSRPKYAPSRDVNDSIVKEAIDELGGHFHGLPLKVVDLSPFRGLIDRLLYIGSLPIGLEIKTKRPYKLTKGEAAWPYKVVVTTKEEVLLTISLFYYFAKSFTRLTDSLQGVDNGTQTKD